MKTVKVDNKIYAKTIQFGNRKKLTVFKNKKKYTRKLKHQSLDSLKD